MGGTAIPGGGDGRAMEKKMRVLEQRLMLVERFVEMRFCESFRDFSTRNLSSVGTEPGNKTGVSSVKLGKKGVLASGRNEEDEEEENEVPPSPSLEEEGNLTTTTYRTRSGRKSTRLTASALGARSKVSESLVKKGQAINVVEEASITARKNKVLTVKITRLEEETTVSGKSSKLQNTSAKTRDQQEDQQRGDQDQVDIEEDPVVKISGSDNEVDVEEDDGGDDYFMFPSGGDAEDSEQDKEGMEATGDDDGDDWNPSGEAEVDDEADKDFEINPSASNKRNSKPSGSGGPKPSKKKKRSYVSSLKYLPEGVQFHALNPDKAHLKECPICHIHTKPEIYNRHLRTHAAERHLKCSMCDMRFFNRDTLRKHERRHTTNLKTKLCRLCGKGFEYPSDVLIHERGCIRRHLENQKPVDPAIIEDVRQKSQDIDLGWPDPNEEVPEGMKKCTRCKKWVEEYNFLKHLQEVHSNWKCSFCDRVYVQKGGLVRHLCNAHGGNRLRCNLCKKLFGSREEFKKHEEECRTSDEGDKEVEETETGQEDNQQEDTYLK